MASYSQTGTITVPVTVTPGSRANVYQTETISVTSALSGNSYKGGRQTGTIFVPTTVSGSSRLHAVMSQTIVVPVTVSSHQFATTASQADSDAEYNKAGHLPYLPLRAYVMNVNSEADVADVPFGKSFVISSDFNAYAGGVLYESGANAGSIGYRLGSAAAVHYVFRAPDPWECMWSIEDDNIYRYELRRDTGVWHWNKYRTLPQRFLDQVRAFDQYDPDRIYDYYAKLAAMVHCQLASDNAKFAKMRDPSLVPAALIPQAASSIGARFDASLDVPKQRAALRLSVPTARTRGTSEAINSYLRQFGYSGWASEVWLRVSWPALLLSGYSDVSSIKPGVLTVVGSPDGKFLVYCPNGKKPGIDYVGAALSQSSTSSDASGLADALTTYGYASIATTYVTPGASAAGSAATSFAAADIVSGLAHATVSRDLLNQASDAIKALHLVSDPHGFVEWSSYLSLLQSGFVTRTTSQGNVDLRTTRNGTITTYRMSALTSSGVVVVPGGADATTEMAHLAAAINTHDGSGTATVVGDPMPSYIDVPHGYSISEPGAYWSISLVTVHINNADGSPLSITNDIVQKVAPEMLRSILPVNVQIHAFATDIPVADEVVSCINGPVPLSFSGVYLREQLTVTRI